MDLKLLKAFVGVAEHGTVSKAAEVLHITQPALSRQIRSLEQQIGFELFERAGRGLTLTPRGTQLLSEYRGLLTHVDALSERTRRLRRGDLSVLRIVAPAPTIEALFPAFLQRYTAHYPDTRLALIDADAADHLTMLERGEADLSINVVNLLPLDGRRFSSHALPRFQVLAASPASSTAVAEDSIDISSLADRPLLLLHRTFATRNVFDAGCDLAGFKPNIFIESRSINALLALAEAGHGIAIIPSIHRVDPARIRTSLVMHRREPLPLNLSVIWDIRRAPPMRYVQPFAELLSAYIRETYPVHPCLQVLAQQGGGRPLASSRRRMPRREVRAMT
jgi:DNA-binding transcriptional LysR family regulator